jgi:type I restriction enzyme S subunit
MIAMKQLKASARYALVGGPFGSKLGRKDYVDDGVPVLRGANLPGDRRFAHEGFVFVSEDKADELAANLAHPGDLVVTQRGTLGQVGLIPESSPFGRFVVSQSQMKLTVDPAVASPLYVYYALSSPDAVERMINMGFSVGVPHVNLGSFESFEIPLPSLPVQGQIAAVLSTYDDLIENNQRRIEILEEMAQALYREWFVDFHYPGHEGEALVDSELGTIPEGWVAAPLFDVAEPTFGFAFESKQFNSEGVGNPVIRIRDLPRNRTETSTTEVAGTQYEVSDGDVLIGMDGIFHMCRWSAGPAYLNQRVVRFRPADDRLSRYQIHLGLERPIRELNETIVGTTVAHLGKRHLQRLHLPVPPEPLRSHARGVFDPLLDQVILLRKSTATLRGTRDLLLPRLISGELDVSGLDLDLRDLVA